MGTKVSEILKILGKKMPAIKKKRREEITPTLTKVFQVSTREVCFKEHSRIRLATIYSSTHMHILI
jgi:hypothetical protein